MTCVHVYVCSHVFDCDLHTITGVVILVVNVHIWIAVRYCLQGTSSGSFDDGGFCFGLNFLLMPLITEVAFQFCSGLAVENARRLVTMVA